ncbi:MAG: UDP-N-acetylmuramoyl-L-alanyl-D-glutamate--2,6-diaminopimelate ligase [Lachnospiraceae bacterium]|nr:UDP-N-acetylmuramoyl-L-alanyl-D-glutamate--2,6-diaminopimelate ligase [Lachnospiraceae bacterium]
MILRDLLENVEALYINGDDTIDITDVVYDSRKVTKGSLFVCMRGFESDGHQYALQALEKGAAAIVVEDLPPFEAETIVQVPDTRKALSAISASWFGNPANDLKLIALTGTKGKTTTSFMVKKLLETAGHKVGVIGTMGAYIGTKHIVLKNTTPESFELQSLFSRMKKAGCDTVVMEASSQGFKLHRTDGITFDYGAFLNLSLDHVSPGEHSSFEEYKSCKLRIFEQTRHAVINLDGDYSEEFLEAAKKSPVVEDIKTVSASKEADLMATDIKEIWEGTDFGVTYKVKGIYDGDIILRMPGIFNVENALVAMAIAKQMGVNLEDAKTALREVTVKGRVQVLPVPPEKGTFIIDYAHNALSMESILKMLSEYKPNRLIVLFGGGGNKPAQRRYDMGLMAGKYADLTILTTDNPRFENPESINQDIIKGLNVHEGEYKIIMDRAAAIRYLLDNCKERDLVAFIGKGHEEYQEIYGVKYHFSEEEIVLDYLKGDDEE